jgi:hypothetical protein
VTTGVEDRVVRRGIDVLRREARVQARHERRVVEEGGVDGIGAIDAVQGHLAALDRREVHVPAGRAEDGVRVGELGQVRARLLSGRALLRVAREDDEDLVGGGVLRGRHGRAPCRLVGRSVEHRESLAPSALAR